MPIPYAPTCSRRSAALATYAENRDCPRCPGNSLSAGDEGRSLPNSRARKLTEPVGSPRHQLAAQSHQQKNRRVGGITAIRVSDVEACRTDTAGDLLLNHQGDCPVREAKSLVPGADRQA